MINVFTLGGRAPECSFKIVILQRLLFAWIPNKIFDHILSMRKSSLKEETNASTQAHGQLCWVSEFDPLFAQSHWWVVHIQWPWVTSICSRCTQRILESDSEKLLDERYKLYEQQVKLSNIHCTVLSWDPMNCPCPIIVFMTRNLKCKYQSQQGTIFCQWTRANAVKAIGGRIFDRWKLTMDKISK